MNIKISDLLKKEVIVLWKNDEDKKFYLTETNSMINHVRNLFATQIKMDKFQDLHDDILNDKVCMSILEQCNDRLVRRTRLLKYRNDLVAEGYTEYTGHTSFVNVKVKMTLGRFKRGKAYVIVYLVVRRKSKMILGIFDDMDEAKVFYDTHYPNGSIVSDTFIIADNDLTKQYAQISDVI